MTYWEAVRRRAKELRTDGCTHAPDWIFVDACYEHDIHYRTHARLDRTPITKREADALLRQRMQEVSPLGVLSPMSQIYWAMVVAYGQKSWDGDERGSPLADWCTKTTSVEAP